MEKNTTEPKVEVLETRIERDPKDERSFFERLFPSFVCNNCNSGDIRDRTRIQKIKKTHIEESGELKTQVYETKEDAGYSCGKCGLESEDITKICNPKSADTGDYGTGAFGF